MPTNEIRAVTFRPIADGEAAHALLIALDIQNPKHLFGFLEEVVGRFKVERMSGPADAAFMLITVTGNVSADDFAHAWRAAIENDAPARAIMGMLRKADVMQSDSQGRVLGQASLVA